MPQSPDADALSAQAIPVGLFREILLWPLAMHLRPASAGVDAVLTAVTGTVDRLTRAGQTTCWRPVNDPSEHIPPPGGAAERDRWRAQCFAEGVYFHEFVQSFLFSQREARPVSGRRRPDLDLAPFRLFRRSDIVAVDVALAGHQADPRVVRCAVERVNLYLFRTGAAVLVVEVVYDRRSGDQGLRLADAQDFHEQFRRAYIPFAMKDGGPPEQVVRQVTWIRGDGGRSCFPIASETVEGMVHRYLDHTECDSRTGLYRRSPPLFPHWEWLLGGALPLAGLGQTRPEDGARWHHVVDERMPTITTVSVTPAAGDPRAGNDSFYYDRTHGSDLMRLCFADGASRGRPYPYDLRSQVNFEHDHMYQAFRDAGTLLLVSGYAFVAYGAGEFFDEVVAAVHMRRHYFQIGLLAHLELATLLTFSSRISRAVAEYDPMRDSAEAFEHVMQTIEDEYLQFMHRFRFTGASNHVQAQEITALWRARLRLPEIFEDLHQEITSATEYLFNRAASRGASMVERLSVIGTIGLIVGLSFTFLSMPILVGREELLPIVRWIERGALAPFSITMPTATLCTPLSLREQLGVVLVVLGGYSLIGWAGLVLMRRLAERHSLPRRRHGTTKPAGLRRRRAPSFFAHIETLTVSAALFLLLCGVALLVWDAWLRVG